MDMMLGMVLSVVVGIFFLKEWVLWFDHTISTSAYQSALNNTVTNFNAFAQAENTYVAAQAASSTWNAIPLHPVTITVNMLINAGYLPSSFPTTTAFGTQFLAAISRASSGDPFYNILSMNTSFDPTILQNYVIQDPVHILADLNQQFQNTVSLSAQQTGWVFVDGLMSYDVNTNIVSIPPLVTLSSTDIVAWMQTNSIGSVTPETTTTILPVYGILAHTFNLQNLPVSTSSGANTGTGVTP